MNLVCLGYGYCAQAYVARYGARFDQIIGTSRTVTSAGDERVRVLAFSDDGHSPELESALAKADAVLVSIAPNERGDPVLRRLYKAEGRADHDPPYGTSALVYLSTIGVYGDHQGAWIDELTPIAPSSKRSQERASAEVLWRECAEKARASLAILRLPGIYGPGRNALEDLKAGRARRIVKPNQVFNRIHVEDIAQSIDAALARRFDGVVNIADDEPAPAPDVIAFAASLLGLDPPPEIAFAEAAMTMSPMGQSFYAECKRVRNDKMKTELGVSLLYPTYREGLRALSLL